MTEVCAETINGNIDLHTTFNSQYQRSRQHAPVLI